MPKMIRRILLFIPLLAAVLLAVHLAGYLSALGFLSSLEDRLLAGPGANYQQAKPVYATRPPWHQYLQLMPEPGRAASAGLDSPLEFSPGRLQATFIFTPQGHPSTGGSGRIEIRRRKAKAPMATRTFGPGDLQSGKLEVEVMVGPQASRLEFWLYFYGPGRLEFKRVVLARPGGWPELAVQALRQFAGDPFWAWWSGNPFQGPWQNRTLREVVRRVSLLQLIGRITKKAAKPVPAELTGLFRFVADRMGGFPGRLARPNLGGSAWDVMLRGGGQCDEQAVILGRLFACLGISSRVLAGSFHPAAPAGHSVLEAYPPGGPAYFDPYLRLYFTDPKGVPLGFQTLSDKPELLEKSTFFANAQPDFKAKVKALLRNPIKQLAFIAPMQTGYWQLPASIRKYWTQKILDRYLGDLDQSLAGNRALKLLAKARVMHLFGSLEAARKEYGRALAASASPFHQRAVRSHLAWLALDQGRVKDACKLAAGLKGQTKDLWAERAEVLSQQAGCGPWR